MCIRDSIKPVVIAEDRQRRLWIGHRGGLVRISRNGGVEQWASDAASDPVPSGQIGWLLHPADGSQWLAAPGGGVQQRDPDSGKLLRDFPAGAASGLGEADIESMVLAADGSPWIACSTGILPVSYTHLDVYKRQIHASNSNSASVSQCRH